MTPEERAEKICRRLECCNSDGLLATHLDFIAAQIAEAEREAVQEDRATRTADDLYKWSREGGFKRGWTAAREKAAKEVDPAWTIHLPKELIGKTGPQTMDLNVFLKRIADSIRKMEPGEDK